MITTVLLAVGGLAAYSALAGIFAGIVCLVEGEPVSVTAAPVAVFWPVTMFLLVGVLAARIPGAVAVRMRARREARALSAAEIHRQMDQLEREMGL